MASQGTPVGGQSPPGPPVGLVRQGSTQDFIYHERQVAAICAVHALNAIVQAPEFDEVGLSEVAQELDEKERKLLQAQGPDNPDLLRHIAGGSNNVDESGNFSIMVLSEALKRAHGLTLSQANMDTVISNATAQRGYILHLQDHWFAIRRIGGEFWNLDSMKKRPSFVGDIYLGAFLSQMRSEGYSIFVVQGELPEPLQGASMGDPQNWHSVTKLKAHESDTSMLGGGSSDAIPAETLASWAATARQDPSMFEIILASLMESTGKARADAEMMLVMAMSQGGDEADQTSSTSGTHPAAHDSRGGPESTEDEDSDLAAAIALSMQQG